MYLVSFRVGTSCFQDSQNKTSSTPPAAHPQTQYLYACIPPRFSTRDILLLYVYYNIREPVERFLRLSGPAAAHVAPHVNMTNPSLLRAYIIIFCISLYIYIYVNHAVMDRGPRDLCARILRISSRLPPDRPAVRCSFPVFLVLSTPAGITVS